MRSLARASALLALLVTAQSVAFAAPPKKPKKPGKTPVTAPADPPPPPAPPPDPNAVRVAELRKKGDTAMDTGYPADALAAYKEAAGLSSDPALHYNMGRALQALTRYPEALAEVEAFNATAPAELKAKVPRLDSLIDDLRAKVATLTVTCNVTGAEVRFAGKTLGQTPLASVKLNAGAGALEVSAEGYLPHKIELTLPGGGLSNLDIQLKSKATTGILIVTSPVTGASVAIDDTQAGNVPVEAALTAGTHTLTLRKEGYESARTSAIVGAGERKTVSIPLDEIRPLTSKWWFWTIVGTVVVTGAVVTIYALTTERKPDSGTIPPGQVGAAAFRF